MRPELVGMVLRVDTRQAGKMNKAQPQRYFNTIHSKWKGRKEPVDLNDVPSQRSKAPLRRAE